MGKRIFWVAAALSLFCSLSGCNNRADEQSQKTAQEEALHPMQQSWRGTLPCADCAGIETSLFLNQDGTWVMSERYLKGPGTGVIATSYGAWARTAEKLVLTDSKGNKSYYRVRNDKLEVSDRNGNAVASSLNYTLQPVKASLPATPMSLRGMYFYMADAAIFTDCATGKRLVVDNNPQLERDFAVATRGESKPVLLVIKGHFTIEPNPDTEKPETTLVPDGRGQFIAGQDCRN